MRRVVGLPDLSRRHGERGAVATLFAVLIGGGVMIGMLSLTVDMGSVWLERRELQNSADAAAVTLASICAKKASDCDPTATPPLLAPLVNGNAGTDQQSQSATRGDATNGQCARKPIGFSFPNMPTCASVGTDASISSLTDCPPLPTWLRGAGSTIPYVEYYSLTKSNGTRFLPKTFSRALAGGGPDVSVSACARAAWGPAGNYEETGIPLTFSICEFRYYVAEEGSIAAPPGPDGYGSGVGQTPLPGADKEKVVYFKASNSSGEPRSCRAHNVDFPGAFGWVSGSDCQATVATGDWLDTDTGNSAPQACSSTLDGLAGKVLSLPIFDCIQRGGSPPTQPVASLDCGEKVNGTKAWYHIAGWARFYVTGLRFPSKSASSPYRGVPCAKNETCLSGWFVSGELNATSIVPSSPDTDFGTYTVLPAG